MDDVKAQAVQRDGYYEVRLLALRQLNKIVFLI